MSRDPKIVLPEGSDSPPAPGKLQTERGQERLQEESDFQPVILKRVDEIRRHPDDILSSAVAEGVEQLERGVVSLALSAVAAGLILCFSAMAVGVVSGVARGASPLASRLAPALVYPLGFIACIMSGSQLFTEHTATAVYPVLDRKASVGKLLRLWALVIAGNLAGAAISATLLALAEDVVQAREGYLVVARHLFTYGPGSLFVSAVLAGWLMALGAWLLLATSNGVAQIALIYAVTFLIGVGGLHHSIAGASEMFTAWFVSEKFATDRALRFLAVTLAGNLAGGSLFVAALNYAHIRRTRAVP